MKWYMPRVSHATWEPKAHETLFRLHIDRRPAIPSAPTHARRRQAAELCLTRKRWRSCNWNSRHGCGLLRRTAYLQFNDCSIGRILARRSQLGSMRRLPRESCKSKIYRGSLIPEILPLVETVELLDRRASAMSNIPQTLLTVLMLSKGL